MWTVADVVPAIFKCIGKVNRRKGLCGARTASCADAEQSELKLGRVLTIEVDARWYATCIPTSRLNKALQLN